MKIFLLIIFCVLPVLGAPDFEREAMPLLAKYCYSCHGAENNDGGIEFHQIKTQEEAFEAHELLARAAEQVHGGEMPPFDAEEFPTAEEEKTLSEALRHIADLVATGQVPRNPGRTTIRRLNRNEYNYTVRDLFGINFQPGRGFPADAAGGEGFDNTADSLFVPPNLLEKYLKAANEIADAIYADQHLLGRYLTSRPEEGKRSPEQAAEAVLNYHVSLAYRRRPDPATDIAPLVALFQKALAEGRSYEEAMRLPLLAILVNPKFLYRIQHDEEGKEEWPLDQFELATRLSYFLWASMPDRELFQLADQGKLREPEVMKAQVLRMLADPKAESLGRHFGGQWLGYDDLIDRVEPDQERFPQFTRSLRASMWRESTAYLNHIFQQNRPLTELIDSDYAFLNAELAQHYGLPPVPGDELQKTNIADRQRGGVIGMGSVLTATSLPLRTSPVKRGKWVLEALLGETPPPPPPDAGVLPEDDRSSEGLSFRRQLEIHRDKKGCASCHAKIDPIGFGLENFDAIGQWRTHGINGQKIDSQAVLPGDIQFSTPLELKSLLMQAKDKFAKNVARKMLAYSLGRALYYYDEAVLNDLVAEMAKNNYSSHSLILAIVNSDPFQNRSSHR
ncbi:MAG: DUF1592 domain-containing protein [Verrucomicrobiales bacterium]